MIGSPHVENVCADPVDQMLSFCGLQYLHPNITHMLWPNFGTDPSKRHYLYIPGTGWTATGTTMTGTMDATGVVTGGTFSYLAPVTCVEAFTIAWDVVGSPTNCFSIGFNRVLTSAERVALASAAFWSGLFAGTAITGAYVTDITGRTYFVDPVDGADVNAGTAPGAGKAWKTVGKANGFAFKPGDGVLFKGGNTYTPTLKPTVSGQLANRVIIGTYAASGGQPVFSAYSDMNGKHYLTIRGIEFRETTRLYASETNIQFKACVWNIGAYGVLGVVITGLSINIEFYGCAWIRASNNFDLQASGYPSTIKMRDCLSARAEYSISGPAYSIAGGATLDLDYHVLVGTSTIPVSVTQGAHVVKWVDPLLTAYPVVGGFVPKFTITCDDSGNIIGFNNLCTTVLDPLGLKATMFVNISTLTTDLRVIAADLVSRGHEISSHSRTHVDLTVTTGFGVTSTNTNPTVDVDYATTTIAFSCDEVGNRVAYDWSGGKTIAELQTALTGKGWTLTSPRLSVLVNCLADTSGPQTVPYTCLLDVSATSRFWDNEINDAVDEIETVTGVAPITLAYPNGILNANLVTWLQAHSDVLVGRGSSGGNTMRLSTVKRFEESTIIPGFSDSDTEATVREWARRYFFLSVFGPSHRIFMEHSISSARVTRYGWFVNELATLGGQFCTLRAMFESIAADHTLTGTNWTKTYDTTGTDYKPLAGSPLRDTGDPTTPPLLYDLKGSAETNHNIGPVKT
jgi:hypothetical protein